MFNVTQLAMSIMFFQHNNFSVQDIADTINNNTFETTQVYKNYPYQGNYIKYYFTVDDFNNTDTFYVDATYIVYLCSFLLFLALFIYGYAYMRSYYFYANDLL